MSEENYFEVPGKLPGLNEIIEAARSHWSAAARQKKDTETYIGYYIAIARRKRRLTPVKEPVYVYITWYEKTQRRDADNVEAGAKFILDAMKNNRIIIDDSRRYVRQVYHRIEDAPADGVRVDLVKIN